MNTENETAPGNGSDLTWGQSTDDDNWFTKGVALVNAGNYDAALQAFSKHIERNPDSEAAWFNKGVTLERLDRLQESLLAYVKATELRPQDEAAWIGQGTVLARLGRHREAATVFSKAIELNPNNPFAWFQKAYELGDKGRHKEAVDAYDEAIRLMPTYTLAWSNKGYELSKLKRHAEAVVAYSRALELEPNSPERWLGKGRALSQLKRYSEALSAFAGGAEVAPERAAFLSYQGDMLLKLKRPEDAFRSYSKAYELDPDKAWVDDASIRRAAQLSGNFRRLRVDWSVDDDEGRILEAWIGHHGRALTASDRFSQRRDAVQLISLLTLWVAAFASIELVVTWHLHIAATFALVTAAAVIIALVVSTAIAVLWIWALVEIDDRYSRLVLSATATVLIAMVVLGVWVLENREVPVVIRQVAGSAALSTSAFVFLTLLIVATDYLIEVLFKETQPHPEALHALLDLVSAVKRQPEKWGDHDFMMSQVDRLERSARFVESIPRRLDAGDATTNTWFAESTLGAACKLRGIKRILLAPGITNHQDLVDQVMDCMPALIVGNWSDVRSGEELPQSSIRWWRRLLRSGGLVAFSLLPLASILGYQALGPVKLNASVAGAFVAAAVLWLILSFVVMDPLYEQKTKALPQWSDLVSGRKPGA